MESRETGRVLAKMLIEQMTKDNRGQQGTERRRAHRRRRKRNGRRLSCVCALCQHSSVAVPPVEPGDREKETYVFYLPNNGSWQFLDPTLV